LISVAERRPKVAHSASYELCERTDQAPAGAVEKMQENILSLLPGLLVCASFPTAAVVGYYLSRFQRLKPRRHLISYFAG
jgi:hypothetical protein